MRSRAPSRCRRRRCLLVAASRAAGKQLLVGYILQVHPSWTEFIARARGLGSPKVMRLNLNQQDKTEEKWAHHLSTMDTVSPLVDCGVHCQPCCLART